MDLLRPGTARLVRALVVLVAGAGLVQAQDSLELRVKEVYLFKFGDFVEWPGSALPKPGQPFVLGILGEDPFGPHLDEAVKGHAIQGRAIQVRRFKRAEDVHGVQILFVGRLDALEPSRLTVELLGLSILTVSDGDTFPGAVLKFRVRGNRVRFEANLEAADQSQLKLSSKLLSLALDVKPAPRPSEK